MIEPFECTDCQTAYEPIKFKGRCPCGGYFLPAARVRPLSAKDILSDTASLWRYKEFFLPDRNEDWKEITAGEGFTPLISLDKDNPSILLKLEFLSPLGGFHDRGYAVLAAMLKHFGADAAGIYPKTERERLAWRTYVQRAGIKGCPDEAGAEPYDHPFFLTGIQTFAYEIWEQLAGKKLEFIVLPAGDPSFALGTFLGFKQLAESKLIEEYPAFLLMEKEGVTTENLSSFMKEQILKILELTNGKRISIAQAEIIQAQKALHSRAIKSNEDDAILYAGFMRYYRDHSIKDQRAILPIGLTNGGL